MEIIRKSLKVYIITFILFVLLTMLLAALICFTGFREAWNCGGMIAVLGISAAVSGILETRVIGRRVLFVFLITAALFVLLSYLLIYAIFS